MKPSGSAAESLAEVFRCRRSELVRLAAFILGDRPAAEDVVQDVFLRMHQSGDRLADLDDPLPYLRGAVVNGCRSVLRRRLLIGRHAGQDVRARFLATKTEAAMTATTQAAAARASLSRSAVRASSSWVIIGTP